MNDISDLKLLYVEDELNTLLLYEKYFKSKFEVVYTARDGIKALETYTKYKPDLLILDINIPLLNGLELTKKIRKFDNNTKIILLTARDDKETLIEAIGLDVFMYLEKPLTRNSLKSMFHKIETFYENELYKTIIFYKDELNEFTWNITKKILLQNKEIIKLTKKEALLLELFINKPNEIIPFEMIYDRIWTEDSYKNFSIPSIKTLVKNLRSKLPASTIKSSYGEGFMFNLK
ncbi:response regulator transcription factor [Arcobacter lacus]|uniref:Two-component system response regulator n=1 Tax=Arcobacter lacus TaxID=1912876 RepID=A0ABX5JGL8_9BACT|nr:response regulator transcription factor [Arcobacter lacus]PUE64647.1 hypothetical protein B0175_09530 [Arcobacter lacus]